AEDGIRAFHVTGVQTCALPISAAAAIARPGQPVPGGARLLCGKSPCCEWESETCTWLATALPDLPRGIEGIALRRGRRNLTAPEIGRAAWRVRGGSRNAGCYR